MQGEMCLRQLEAEGFTLLPQVFSEAEVEALCAGLGGALADGRDGPLRSQNGSIYGARNVLALWPEAADAWRKPVLVAVLEAVLGPGFGLVRGLYFDKPPGQSWTLPWHKDLTVAVRDNRLPGRAFGKPTRKAGVPHVEAPLEVLTAMLTARIHLDDVTEENGPLQVLPGSHRTGKTLEPGAVPPRKVLAQRGDVLLMRPLLAHASGHTHPETRRHRRILHLELSAEAELPDGYAWYDFRPGRATKEMFNNKNS